MSLCTACDQEVCDCPKAVQDRGIVAWAGGERHYFPCRHPLFTADAYDRMLRAGLARHEDFQYRWISVEAADWDDPKPLGKGLYQ